MEKSFCHDLQHRIMIHPYDTVQPTGMGMVEIPAELCRSRLTACKKHMIKESDTFTGVQKMTIIQVGKRRADR